VVGKQRVGHDDGAASKSAVAVEHVPVVAARKWEGSSRPPCAPLLARMRWPALKRRVGCRGGVVSEMRANGGGRRAAHHARAADSTRPPAAWAIHAGGAGRWRAGRRAEVQNKSNGPNSNVSSRPGRLRRPNRNKARTTAGQAVAEGCQGAGMAGEWSWGRSELEPAPGRLGVPLRGVTQLSLNSVIVGFQGEEGIAR